MRSPVNDYLQTLYDRHVGVTDGEVADYIPGYERNRKHRITIGHVLAHRAAVPPEFASRIPLAAVPVSLIGTFAAMHALGFSINALSLFGLVLAIA